MPSCGAVMVCCIFMASRTSTGSPVVTDSPAATWRRTTDPGIGASREPLATWSAGSTKRGRRVSDTCPRDDSTSTCSRSTYTRKRLVTELSDSEAATATSPSDSSATRRPLAKPVRVGIHSTSVSSKAVRWGCEATLRQPEGMPRCTLRPARACSASTTAAAKADAFSVSSSTGRGVSAARSCRSRKSVDSCSPTNAGCRSTSTSRSRLVRTPWISARSRVSASLRSAAFRSGPQQTTFASIAS